jgi:hypothetical protein
VGTAWPRCRFHVSDANKYRAPQLISQHVHFTQAGICKSDNIPRARLTPYGRRNQTGDPRCGGHCYGPQLCTGHGYRALCFAIY